MTPERVLLSATLIARNEEHNIERCFDSLWPHVDEIVIVDTGSEDETVERAKAYAEEHGQPEKVKIGRCTDCNNANGEIEDFSAARQVADDIATGEWFVWCDLDDEIHGLEQMRKMAAEANADITAFFCRYRYATDQDANPISELWRERLFRNNGARWEGRLHEHKLVKQGAIVRVDPQIAEWIHHRDHAMRTGERNLRILHAWLDDEPENARVIQSIAMEYMGEQKLEEAAEMFKRYLECPGEEVQRRAQSYRHMAVMLMMLGRVGEAHQAAMQAASEHWMWADTHLTLAEVSQTLGRPDQALVHVNTAMQIGQPDTLLIVNPLQYTAHPRALIGVCLGQMGRYEEGIASLEEALRIAPSYPLAAQQLPLLRGAARKEHAIGSMVALADVLVESGEPMKARALLDNAPWYVAEHEQIVAKRAELWRLIEQRVQTPADLPADEAADAFVLRHRDNQSEQMLKKVGAK